MYAAKSSVFKAFLTIILLQWDNWVLCFRPYCSHIKDKWRQKKTCTGQPRPNVVAMNGSYDLQARPFMNLKSGILLCRYVRKRVKYVSVSVTYSNIFVGKCCLIKYRSFHNFQQHTSKWNVTISTYLQYFLYINKKYEIGKTGWQWVWVI